jgi:L-lactate dehydrogenase complex protein LldG
MSAREDILGRVRAATGARGADETAREDAAATRIIRHPPGPVPRQGMTSGQSRLTQFLNKLDQASASVGRVSGLAELPRAVGRELRVRNLPARIRTGGDPLFSDLRWSPIEVSQGPGRREEPATLSRAEWGIAETGTLVLCSGPANPVTLSFLGETHFVVLRRTDLVAGFEDMWTALRARRLDPRTINMVTGPSRSGDIGQVLQLGAHGPVALHVFILD